MSSWKVVSLKCTEIEVEKEGITTRNSSKRPKQIETIQQIEEEVISADQLEPVSLQNNPFAYHCLLNKELKETTKIISYSFPSTRKEGDIFTSSMEINGDDEEIDDVCSDKSKKVLENLFVLLHSMLLGKIKNNLRQTVS